MPYQCHTVSQVMTLISANFLLHSAYYLEVLYMVKEIDVVVPKIPCQYDTCPVCGFSLVSCLHFDFQRRRSASVRVPPGLPHDQFQASIRSDPLKNEKKLNVLTVHIRAFPRFYSRCYSAHVSAKSHQTIPKANTEPNCMVATSRRCVTHRAGVRVSNRGLRYALHSPK